MSALLAWFEPRGRLAQRAFVRFVLGQILFSAALLCLAIVLAAHGMREAAFAALTGVAALAAAVLVQTIRRLHDRDRTGWWLGLPIGLTAMSFVPVETQADAHPAMVVVYALATVAATLWFAIETLGRRGTRGPNRYGDAPSAGRR